MHIKSYVHDQRSFKIFTFEQKLFTNRRKLHLYKANYNLQNPFIFLEIKYVDGWTWHFFFTKTNVQKGYKIVQLDKTYKKWTNITNCSVHRQSLLDVVYEKQSAKWKSNQFLVFTKPNDIVLHSAVVRHLFF